MKFPMAHFVRSFFVITILSILLIPEVGKADDIKLFTSLGARAGYNDNITFNNTEPISDIYTNIVPAIKYNVADEGYDITIDGYAEIIRFSDEKDLDTENYRGGIFGGYRLSERLLINGDAYYLKDTTLDSQLRETGRVVERDNRYQASGAAGMALQLDELSDIGIVYRYTDTSYDSDSFVNRDEHNIQIPYSRWFNERTDQWLLQPSYARTDLENSDKYEYYSISVGWTHIFSEIMRMRNLIGYGYAVYTDETGQYSDSTGNADLGFEYSGNTFSTRFGLLSVIAVDADGQLTEVDQLYCTIGKRMTERWSINFIGSVYSNRPIEDYFSVDSMYYNFMPSLSYQITERSSLNASYQYSYDYYTKEPSDSGNERNIIEAMYSINFPVVK